jgi:hypothetical protein
VTDRLAQHRGTRLTDIGHPGLTWYSTEPLGHYSSLGLVSSGPVAIIAGFVLSGAVAVATMGSPELLDTLSVVAFSLSALVLFSVLMLVVEANATFSTPDDRLSWYPEAQVSEAVLDELRERQRTDFARYVAMRQRILSIYPFGLGLALVALAAVVGARTQGRYLTFDDRGPVTSDWLLTAAAVVLAAAALYVCSFSRRFPGLDARRYDAALARGTELLGWTSTRPAPARVGRHAVLTDLPPDPPA